MGREFGPSILGTAPAHCNGALSFHSYLLLPALLQDPRPAPRKTLLPGYPILLPPIRGLRVPITTL